MIESSGRSISWLQFRNNMKLENNRIPNLRLPLVALFGLTLVAMSLPLLAQTPAEPNNESTPNSGQAVTPTADTDAQEKALQVLRQKMAELDGTAASPAPPIELKTAWPVIPAGVNAANGQTKTQAETSIEKASGDKTLYSFRA